MAHVEWDDKTKDHPERQQFSCFFCKDHIFCETDIFFEKFDTRQALQGGFEKKISRGWLEMNWMTGNGWKWLKIAKNG